jgi:hypothetical protein
VPYLLRRPTIVAFEPWQVGFESRVPLAEQASTILAGSPAGRQLAESLGVGYVVANPSCTPELPSRLGGRVVVATDELVVVDLRRPEPPRTIAPVRRLPVFGLAAVALLLLDVCVRVVVGGSYPGATWLLLAACGLALLPFVPAQMARPSVLLAVLPALAVGSFSILLTTMSIVGVRLGETSIRAATIVLVVALVAVGAAVQPASTAACPRWSVRREAVVVALLVGVFAFALHRPGTSPIRSRQERTGATTSCTRTRWLRRSTCCRRPAEARTVVFATLRRSGLYGPAVHTAARRLLTAGIVVLSAPVLSVYAAATLWAQEPASPRRLPTP